MTTRRTLLLAALALPVAACATERPAPPAAPRPPSSAAPPPADPAPLAALERQYGCRLGVHALATDTGATLAHRADERFAFCSTYKALAVAAVLDRHSLSYLDERVRIERAAVDSVSPITEHHIGATMTIRQLCDAAIRYSDGTAANLLVRALGGPAALTAYFRELGDHVSRLDQYEPVLNRNSRADPRDTTTPRAAAATYRRVVLGDALPADKRALQLDWMKRVTTGAKGLRAGLPHGWTLADKTGSGDYGRANDIGVAWRPGAGPVVIAVMSDRDGYSSAPTDGVIAAVSAYAASVL